MQPIPAHALVDSYTKLEDGEVDGDMLGQRWR
jgi:hypothetical protein